MMKMLRQIGGIILFILGLIALVVPFVPGWLLIALGLYLLSLDSPGIERRIRVVRERFPTLDRLLSAGKQKKQDKNLQEPPAETM